MSSTGSVRVPDVPCRKTQGSLDVESLWEFVSRRTGRVVRVTPRSTLLSEPSPGSEYVARPVSTLTSGPGTYGGPNTSRPYDSPPLSRTLTPREWKLNLSKGSPVPSGGVLGVYGSEGSPRTRGTSF